jgi:hypothetical protein
MKASAATNAVAAVPWDDLVKCIRFFVGNQEKRGDLAYLQVIALLVHCSKYVRV